MMQPMPPSLPIIAIVPAAGVGSRMQADKPKQYLTIDGKTVLEHTVEKLLAHHAIEKVIVAISETDPYYEALPLACHANVIRVAGGKERADSVLSALNYLTQHSEKAWVMVHDAARPCFHLSDIEQLIAGAISHPVGAILAAPVRDTMKRSTKDQHIEHTVEREQLWHALTPQMFPSEPLHAALSQAIAQGAILTDEASAFEWLGLQPALVAGRADNIKITQPEDLALAEFYLTRYKDTL